MSAIPGIAGLEPTISLTRLSKKILLANKESIVCGWRLIKKNSKIILIGYASSDGTLYSNKILSLTSLCSLCESPCL